MKRTHLLYAMITGWILMMSLTGCVTVTTQYPGVAAGAAPQQATPIYMAAGQQPCQCGHSCAAPTYYAPYHYGQPQGQYSQGQPPAQSGPVQYGNGTQPQTYPTSEPLTKPQSETTHTTSEEKTRIVYVPTTPPIISQPEQQTTIQNSNSDMAKDVIDVAIYAIDAIRNASDRNEEEYPTTRGGQSGGEQWPTGGVTGMGGMGGTIRTPNIAANNGNTTEDCEADTDTASEQSSKNTTARYSTPTTLPSQASSQGGRIVVQSKKQERSGSVFTGSGSAHSTAKSGQGEVRQTPEQRKPRSVEVPAQSSSSAQLPHIQTTSSQPKAREVKSEELSSNKNNGAAQTTLTTQKPTAQAEKKPAQTRTPVQHHVQVTPSSQPKAREVKSEELPSNKNNGAAQTTLTTQKPTAQAEKKPAQTRTANTNNNFTVGSGTKSSTTATQQAAQSQAVEPTAAKPAAVEVITPASSASSPGTGMNATPIMSAPTTVVGQENTNIQPASNPN